MKAQNLYFRGFSIMFFILLISILSNNLNAQGLGKDWPSLSSYESMSCSELSFELTHLKKDMVLLQTPNYYEEKALWNEALLRFKVIIGNYEKRCRLLSAEEKVLPEPATMALLPEKDLVETALKALRNEKYKACEKLLIQGAMENYPDAQYNLGMLYLTMGKNVEGKKWLTSASDLGSVKAKDVLKSLQK